jgi:hypothetical protein
MSLSDLFGASLEAPVAAIRRYVVCYAIAAAAAIGALIYSASAATRALEIALGPVEARAIMALALALIAAGGFVAPRLIAKASRDDANAQARVKAMSREEKIAMVLEALRFGFAMGSRKPASQNNDGRK